MNRRIFIKKSSIGAVALGVSSLGFSALKKEDTKITILHTNDVHSQIEPLSNSHYKYPNMGGFSRRATLIEKIRKENEHVLLLDAGDIFQGTPYFNYYGGEIEFKLMSMMQYDFATLGNHDFDNGMKGLLKQLPNASFSFVSANYDFKNTVLDGFVTPYSILKKGDIKIGIFGLGVALSGLVDPKLYGETQYLDPITVSQDIVNTLKHENECDLIICLSHLGYAYKDSRVSDKVLASKTKDIDLIIGGHTHTLLKEPTVIQNSIGENVLINQCGKSGVYLGQVDFHFSSNKNKVSTGRNNIV